MKKTISKEFMNAINEVKESFPDENPVLYAFNEVLGIFVIRTSDAYNTWYSFHTISSSLSHAVCFRSVNLKLQADQIFFALTAMPDQLKANKFIRR